ncbi:TonB-dependent receptor domain-containing protein [Vibrio viridaestus]|uniref:Vitamin B12 transporter BtuB n=1 Tax=Vibrio viridaestus TaxID=2487322 RepID=A0A3N9TDC9_9VIBR|nr:TonB-dependent receptor [Vibrio viridaestus]RQW61525.1 TonB-dependent receptor [Vibrio viridaestus]
MKKSALAMAVAASLFSYASTSYAASDSAQTTDDTVVVTANRFEQKIDSTTAPVVVVTKQEIERIQASDLLDVLNTLPGIQIARNGSYGQTSSVFIRGTNDTHTLVLIDGARVGSSTTGTASLSTIPLVSISRIEYLRGPRAAVYGSDALGGVINIITDNSSQETELGAVYGSDNYRDVKALTSGYISEQLHASLGYEFQDVDGYSVKSGAGNEDDDGYLSRNLTSNLDYKFNEQWQANLLVLLHNGRVEFDSADKFTTEQNYNVVSNVKYSSDTFNSQLMVAANQDKRETLAYGSTYETLRQEVNWTNQYLVSDIWTVGGGVEWYVDDVSKSSVSYDETSRYNTAAYLTTTLNYEQYDAEASVRHDDNQRYGENNTWQLGLGYRINDTYRLTANGGTGYHAPTFNQLYYPNYGDPDLKPEESKNVEIALSASYDIFDIRLSGFRNDIDNLISGQGSTVASYNEAIIKGAELEFDFDTGPFSHKVSYDYTDAKDKDTNYELRRRAKHSAKWNSSYSVDSWILSMTYTYQGSRFEDKTNSEVLGAYSLFDFSVAYQFDNGIKLGSKLTNAFDADYETADGYNTADRKAYVSIDYKF